MYYFSKVHLFSQLITKISRSIRKTPIVGSIRSFKQKRLTTKSCHNKIQICRYKLCFFATFLSEQIDTKNIFGFSSFSSNCSSRSLNDVLLTSVGIGTLSLLGVNSENVRSVSSRVLDSLVSSALRGLLGFNELVNLRGLFSDLIIKN